MRQKLKIILLALLPLRLAAAPADPMPQTVTQADGSVITLYHHGDEWYDYWTNEQGEIVEPSVDGQYHAVSTEQARLIRKAASTRQPRRRPGVRNFPERGLVILAEYQDIRFAAGNTRVAFDSLLNSDHYHYMGAPGSVRQYFADQSDGKYVPNFDVVGPILLPYNHDYYGTDGNMRDTGIGSLVMDACFAADAQGTDFTQYDGDQDGIVDLIYIIYAGYGQADGGASTTIWPVNWDMESVIFYSLYDKTRYPGYYYYSDTNKSVPTIDGKQIIPFAMSPELNHRLSSRNGVGTICHEFSHVLGLPDLYNTQNSSDKTTPGYWHLMEHGNYNNSQITPAGYSVYDKFYLGWIDEPTILRSEPQNVTLPADGATYYQVYENNISHPATTENEAYYIENRQRTAGSWDEYLPGHGMLIWRVKYNETLWVDNTPNNGSYKRMTLIPAHGSSNIAGNQTDPFPGSGNVPLWQANDNHRLNAITETDGVITFLYNGGIEEGSLSYYLDGVELISGPEAGIISMGQPLEATFRAAEGYYPLDEELYLIEVDVNGEDLSDDCVSLDNDILTIHLNAEQVNGYINITIYNEEDSPANNQLLYRQAQAKKVMHRGEILIIRGGKIYHISGLYENR